MDNSQNNEPGTSQNNEPGVSGGDDALEQSPSTSMVEAPSDNPAPGEPSSDHPENKVTQETVKVEKDELPSADLKLKLWQRLIGRFNVYVFVLAILVMMAVIVMALAYLDSRSNSIGNNPTASQNLSPSALQQLANSDTNVGSSGQVLNVESSAIFAGNVLARQDFQVAGNLTVGGTLAINNVSVAGTAQFGQIQINKNLNVAGDSNLQGNLTVTKGLQVTGSGNFGGTVTASQITTSSLQLNGDLVLSHHIVTNGSTPSLKDGAALGNGGTANLSGSDTSGSININTGSNTASGCFMTITFSSPFNSTPHVIVSPVGYSAGGLSYYITRTTTSFSVCDASTPPAGSSFGFDYVVLD
jgi:hypothetical protein